MLQPVLEAWSGVKLKHSAIYGIRIYRRGSYLGQHVDVVGTHVISAIINVGQKVRCRWALNPAAAAPTAWAHVSNLSHI